MLGQYKFKIVYTPRKDNSRADALSQRSDIAGTKTINSLSILKTQDNRSLRLAKYINNLTIKTGINVSKELQELIIR